MNKAILYAEKHGIIEYQIENNSMIYYEKWSNITYKCILNLDTMEETRKPLK